mmetsp:Transcript_18671/g.60887  ORF Transcript_18671/g.60887 Transcript_18671/m.60887 type:complete len:154 (-) Transcript_18671:768-1229(-)
MNALARSVVTPTVARASVRRSTRSVVSGARVPARVSARTAKVAGGRRAVQVRAEAKDTFDTEEVIKTLQEKWETTENKSGIALYSAGAVVVLWVSATIVGAINSVPVLPKLMELVGLGYSAWFVYRYLLFKDSRKELVEDIDALKAKISGDEE